MGCQCTAFLRIFLAIGADYETEALALTEIQKNRNGQNDLI
jgi:hypothetical protein